MWALARRHESMRETRTASCMRMRWLDPPSGRRSRATHVMHKHHTTAYVYTPLAAGPPFCCMECIVPHMPVSSKLPCAGMRFTTGQIAPNLLGKATESRTYVGSRHRLQNQNIRTSGDVRSFALFQAPGRPSSNPFSTVLFCCAYSTNRNEM